MEDERRLMDDFPGRGKEYIRKASHKGAKDTEAQRIKLLLVITQLKGEIFLTI